MLKRHCYVCRFAFLLVRHCVNLVKGVNDVFPAPISRDYRRGDIEGHMAEFILCWCNNSPPLKGRPANDFSTVHVRQGDNAFFHTDPKLRRQRCSRVCLIFRQGKCCSSASRHLANDIVAIAASMKIIVFISIDEKNCGTTLGASSAAQKSRARGVQR